MGRETRKRGIAARGQTLPRFWYSCKKGNRGKKYFIFAFFFVDNDTLCRELIIFANLQDSHGIAGGCMFGTHVCLCVEKVEIIQFSCT